ncbi:MAG: L,D-transpeptidase family protein [Chloroflexi bacterium]|nr:L,D-transpeptidase family protein [Chloroflexota bacterium]MCC6895177.1 L,D-transpeptidase family protein [Anaerolineae bacterium]
MQQRRAYSQAQATQPIRVRQYPPQQQQGYRPPQPVPYAYPVPPRPTQRIQPKVAPRAKASNKRVYLWLAAGAAAFMLMSCAAFTLGLGLVYGRGILPGVSAGGVSLGGLSQTEAPQKLASEWNLLRLTDGQRSWRYTAADLGISLDASATAQQAYEQGRSDLANVFGALIGRVETQPIIHVDTAALENTLITNADQFSQAPVNAGVKLENGQVTTTPPQNGRSLDVAATIARLQQDSGTALANGRLELVMQAVAPAVSDASPMVEQARRLLTSPLDIRIFDPITGDSVYWSAQPDQWANWLTADPDPTSPTGLALTTNDAPVRAYLAAQSAVLDATRYLNYDEAVSNVQQAIREGRTNPYTRVYHHDSQYVVQPGDTITSIAWDVGQPYLYIQQANGDINSVSVGQSITIPSPDNYLPYAVNPDKRIVVSISQQHTWVYENGQIKWDWAASTGIPDSPTWPGIYQIISHKPNAYAGNWDLWMPHFMGVYQPIPGADFTNGFHGFPTRGGWQLLWTNSLGTKVTYGCILLSNENAELLYNWAEEGIIVEIQP